MRTLFLNPPSFEGFDGGASSRWPASREIESYWYPVWLCYPAGMLPDSKVVDAPPHKISIEQTVEMGKDFELLVLYTSTPGFHVDVKMAEMMKDVNPKLKVAFVGPPVTTEPDKTLLGTKAIDFVVRREFDHQIVDFAKGKPLDELPGVSFRRNGHIVNNPEGPAIEDLDSLPWVTKVYKRDLDITRYNVPFLLNPFVSLYTSRGCPALVHVLPVAADALRAPLAAAVERRRGERSALRARTVPADEGNLLRRRYLQLPQGSDDRAVQEAQAAQLYVVAARRASRRITRR